jgi:hypothetical protein
MKLKWFNRRYLFSAKERCKGEVGTKKRETYRKQKVITAITPNISVIILNVNG